MKLLYDFFPIILFLVAYKAYDIFIATAIAIAATFVQISYSWFKNRRVEKMHLISGGLLLVLGGLTIALQNRAFIMWKPTVVYWLFTIVLLFIYIRGKHSLFRGMFSMMDANAQAGLNLPFYAFRKADLIAAIFFFIMGITNAWFVHAYYNAEKELYLAYPEISTAQINGLKNLDCKTSLPETAIKPCIHAQNKENSWVNFKVFGILGIMLAMMVCISVYFIKQAPKEPHSSTPPNEYR